MMRWLCTRRCWLTSLIMRMFAPVARPVGLHWHPYAQTILPPILDLPPLQASVDGSVLVYLPFEDQDQISALLQQAFVSFLTQRGHTPTVVATSLASSDSVRTHPIDDLTNEQVLRNTPPVSKSAVP